MSVPNSTMVNTNTNAGFTTSQVTAIHFVVAQQAFVQAQTAFQSALQDLKAGTPGAKALADKAGIELKIAKTEMDAAEKTQTGSRSALAENSKKLAQANNYTCSRPTDTAPTPDFFNPRRAFVDVTHMTSLASFPNIPSMSNCNSVDCSNRENRTLDACPCQIRDAFSGLSGKDLNIVKGHLHASRFARAPIEVQKAAKECYDVVNRMINNSRGGQGGQGGKQGGKNFKGTGFEKGARGRKG